MAKTRKKRIAAESHPRLAITTRAELRCATAAEKTATLARDNIRAEFQR